MNKNSKYDRWSFTSWKKPTVNPSLCKLIVWQKELTPGTQLVHYQGYVEFNKFYSLGTVKQVFKDKTMHVEQAIKNRIANVKYCTKLGSRHEDNESFMYDPNAKTIDERFEQLIGAMDKLEF